MEEGGKDAEEKREDEERGAQEDTGKEAGARGPLMETEARGDAEEAGLSVAWTRSCVAGGGGQCGRRLCQACGSAFWALLRGILG